jgi:hypothetical protein
LNLESHGYLSHPLTHPLCRAWHPMTHRKSGLARADATRYSFPYV